VSELTEAQQDEYRAAQPPVVDPKGRALTEHMTDRAIAEESLILLRAFGDAQVAVGKNPMVRVIPGMRGMFSGK